MTITDRQEAMVRDSAWDFSDLRALFISCTLKPSPEVSHTEGLAAIAIEIMRKNGVTVDLLRAVDHEIPVGVWPDMTEHSYPRNDWPALFEQVQGSDILVLCTPIWLGEKSSVCTKMIERLYGNSHLLNDAGQYAYYGRVGGCLVTGNEDGVKHCAMNVLYSLQHLGFVISATGRRRLDRRSRTRTVLSRPGVGWTQQRLHQPQHHLHDLEPAPLGPDPQRCRCDPGPRQPALGVGRRVPFRFRQPGAPVTG